MPYADKQKHKEWVSQWYQRNKSRITEKQRVDRWMFKQGLVYLLGGKCKRCGERDIRCLVFHHHSGEKEGLMHEYIRDTNKSKALTEVLKCRVFCANCHVLVHMRQWNKAKVKTKPGTQSDLKRRKKYKMAAIELLGGKCEVCGESSSDCLTFHHIGEKTDLIANMIRKRNKRVLQEILEEAKKCRLLCFNCHLKEHATAAQAFMVMYGLGKAGNGVQVAGAAIGDGATEAYGPHKPENAVQLCVPEQTK